MLHIFSIISSKFFFFHSSTLLCFSSSFSHFLKSISVLHHILTFETLTDVRTFLGAGSPMSLLAWDSEVRTVATDRGTISGGGPKMSCPLSSLVLAFDMCFLAFESKSLCNVPLNSRCFATSGIEVGFLGEILPSALNDIWLIPFRACWKSNHKRLKSNSYDDE